MKWRVVLVALLLGVGIAVAQQQNEPNPLAGVIDFHCHVAPDAQARPITEFDLARFAKRAGMRGIVIKSHYLMTADRAQVVMQELGGIEVFGGVVLNRAVGGINAEVVRKMTQIDGKRGRVVWLPTFDSEAQVKFNNEQRPFVSVVKDGKPVPELKEVFELVAQNDLVLEMGHSAAEESLILIEAAKQAGVKKIVVTHAMADPIGATEQHMRKMADMGAIIECVWLNTLTSPGTRRRIITVQDYARVMKAIGPQHFIIASDLGQQFNPVHPDGMIAFIRGLKGEGITDEQIDIMARKNPAKLLGLDR